MKILTRLESLQKATRPITLAAGFFDGVHRGHRKVIDRAITAAHATDGEAWVLTFETHPLKVLLPQMAPPLLTSNDHRMQILKRTGIDGCLVLSFDPALAETSPRVFVRKLCEAVPSLAHIVVGRRWSFGQGGQGNPRVLAGMARHLGYQLTVVRPVMHGGLPVSSTRIRSAVKEGTLHEAEVMLGRPFSVLGRVVGGEQRGRSLGFPTANIDARNEVLPPVGVYAVYALIGGRTYEGVVNFGRRPTFGGSGKDRPLLELHVLDTSKHLYGKTVEVFFVSRLRDERRFRSGESLRKAIEKDACMARLRLAEYGALRICR